MTRMWASLLMHWISLTVITVLAAACVQLRRQSRLQAAERWRERRMREELEAYARLDASTTQETKQGMDLHAAQKALAARVCRAVVEKSVFQRVTLMLRDVEGRFICTGYAGMDDLTVAALHRWGLEIAGQERGEAKVTRMVPAAWYKGARSYAINLGAWEEFDPEVGSWAMSGRRERRRWRRALVAPIRDGAGSGRMVGGAGGLRGRARAGRLDGGPG